MKIAVYTISLNEEKFVKRWYEANKDADVLMIADTGSTDGTVELARSLGIIVHEITVVPWRFDVARNISVDLLPEDVDVMIAIDMDEVLYPGWRPEVERAFGLGHKPKPLYTWNHNPDGSNGIQYYSQKVTPRFGYHWHNMVHETIEADPGIEECPVLYPSIEIHHFADNRKSRAQYLDLLEADVKENPESSRNVFYLGREYMFRQRYTDSIYYLKKYLEMPTSTWPAERANACTFIAQCHQKQNNKKELEYWGLRAVVEDRTARESYYILCQFYYHEKKWQDCIEMTTLALQQTEKGTTYMTNPQCWDGTLEDILQSAQQKVRR